MLLRRPAKPRHRYAGKFIAFAGIDGAGKTTTATKVAAEIGKREHPVLLVKHKNPAFIEPYAQRQCERLRAAIWDPTQHHNILGHRHYHFLIAAWLDMIDRRIIRPALEAGRIVIVDSWYHKQAARAATRRDVISSCHEDAFLESLTEPDFTVLLDISPNLAATRKEQLSASESGMHDGFKGGGIKGFELFQSRIRKELLMMAKQSSQMITITVGDQDLEEVAREILGHLSDEWLLGEDAEANP